MNYSQMMHDLAQGKVIADIAQSEIDDIAQCEAASWLVWLGVGPKIAESAVWWVARPGMSWEDMFELAFVFLTNRRR